MKNNYYRLLDRVETAYRTSFSPMTFAVWDSEGRYDLRPMKIENKVYYYLGHIYSLFGMQDPSDRLLDRKRAADFMESTAGTLAHRDCYRLHTLECLKFGRTIRYRLSDLIRFKEELMMP